MARHGTTISERARWKAPTKQVEPEPPALIDEELVRYLQAEVAVVEIRYGRDVAILEVVKESTRPLTHGQLEGLEAPPTQVAVPPLAAGQRQPSADAAAQLPMRVLS